MDLLKEFGEALTASRERRGFTRLELAERVFGHGDTAERAADIIAKWEEGAWAPTAAAVEDLAWALGSPDVLRTDIYLVESMKRANARFLERIDKLPPAQRERELAANLI
jgi:transcriptional regulator with XRE-family HTH domain